MRVSGEYEAAASEEEHDPESEQWSRAEHLIAAVRDELQSIRYMYERTHGKHKPKWTPSPTPRPGVKPKRKKRPKLDAQQAAALRDYLARTQGAPDDN